MLDAEPENRAFAALIPLALEFETLPLPGCLSGHAGVVRHGEDAIPCLAACSRCPRSSPDPAYAD